VRRALDFLRRLVMLRGAPADVLPRLEALLDAEGLESGAVARLRTVLALLEAYDVPAADVTLDLGLGRGLHYYTGVLFELYADGAEQLGGGGRYDDLAAILGARQPLPAVGFSLGLERVIEAVGEQVSEPQSPTVVVGQGDGDGAIDAVRIARLLRDAGWTALLDVRERKTNAALKHARAIRADVYAEPSDDGAALRWLPLNGTAEQRFALARDALPHPPTAALRSWAAANLNGAHHDE
jgi:histidyl-tRNA synthetase